MNRVGRIAPVGELVNTFEFAAMAERRLDSLTYAEIAGSEREAFERITFRPRLMVNTTKLDLTTELFGAKMFAPILIGPLAQQKRFHPEGELAMARGAAAAKATMVIASDSSYPLEQVATLGESGLVVSGLPGGRRCRRSRARAAGDRRRMQSHLPDAGCSASC